MKGADGSVLRYFINVPIGQEIVGVGSQGHLGADSAIFCDLVPVEVPRTPGRGIMCFGERNFEPCRRNEESPIVSKGLEGGMNTVCRWQPSPHGSRKESPGSTMKSGHLPRPVLVRTSESEIRAHFSAKENGYPTVSRDMPHSLRFWLAVLYANREHRKTGRVCAYFGVDQSGVKNAIRKRIRPEDTEYLAPGEFDKNNVKKIVKLYGREIDKEKFLKMSVGLIMKALL